MERTISQEERIRRAEEIYNRRRQEYFNQNKRYFDYEEAENKKDSIKKRIMRKTLRQIAICLIIYLTIYILVNSEYFFAENIRSKIKEYLTYEIDFRKIYDEVSEYINNKMDFSYNKLKDFNKTQNNQMIETSNEECVNQTESERENKEGDFIEENSQAVGGAETEDILIENKTQEELDAEYIKQNYAIIWPVNGVITSKYGTRTPTDIITAEHYGLDIGADIGTSIVAAMDGTVTLSSTYGDYGKHLQIENGDVSTLYAHCSLLCVAEGESVLKGQKIAEVGQTRKDDWATFTF